MKQKGLYYMKKTFCLLLSLVLLLGVLPVSALAATVPQKEGEVYLVSTADELNWVAEQVNTGSNTAIQVRLTADITLPQTWPGIGTGEHKFAGTFDGDGKKVTLSDSSWGLFCFVMGQPGAVATIKNVITEGQVKNSPIAASAGYAHINRCINRAAVKANSGKVGGILGVVDYVTNAGVHHTEVRITECGNEGTIEALSDTGGILGYTDCGTFISRCYNAGAIKGASYTGGIVGSMQNQNGGGLVEYSYNTGKVEGGQRTAGIIGNMMNSVTISHCYNSGEAYYAFAGHRYNYTSAFGDGCYFLGVNSAKCSPDATETLHHNATSYEISTRATAKSAAEMATAAFSGALGSYFKQSCPTPVLTWQEAVAHTGAVCENCSLGSTEKETYKITYQEHDFFTLTGPETVQQGDSVEIGLKLTEGYKRNGIFAVKANGTELTETESGIFVATNVSGPLSITVTGVQRRKEAYDIKWSDVGNGYRIDGADQVPENNDYSFRINFEPGFQPAEGLFEVKAVEIVDEALLKQGAVPDVQKLSADRNGNYYIESVNCDYRIVVTGVGTYGNDSVTVNFRVTEGYYEFHSSNNPAALMTGVELTVPYFDLGLYDLQKYYYNPNCYVDENGESNARQQVGNPEMAYNNITIMHAFIVATERYMMGYTQDEVGRGLHKTVHQEYINAFNDVDQQQTKVSWTQDVGSSFMNFWTHGTNLNYYLNYVYPLALPNWGSTSDQILLSDGDDLSVHLITGAGSGSRFGVFTVNDRYKEFDQSTVRDEYSVYQGEKVNLTLYWTGTGPLYSTEYELRPGAEIYWVRQEEATGDIRQWNKTELGVSTQVAYNEETGEYEEELPGGDGPAALVTESNGTVTIDTSFAAPGIYYLAAPGGYSEKGAMNDKDESSHAEAGAALFRLEVKESTLDGMLGDVNGSKTITAEDATMVLQAVVGLVTDISLGVTDVNASGTITAEDATLILQRIVGLIDSFPAENK